MQIDLTLEAKEPNKIAADDTFIIFFFVLLSFEENKA